VGGVVTTNLAHNCDDADCAEGAPRPRRDLADHPEVLTVDEAAAFLRVDRKTVYTAVAEGQLPGRRVGRRRIVILRDQLLAWLRSNEPVLPSRRRSR